MEGAFLLGGYSLYRVPVKQVMGLLSPHFFRPEAEQAAGRRIDCGDGSCNVLDIYAIGQGIVGCLQILLGGSQGTGAHPQAPDQGEDQGQGREGIADQEKEFLL